MRSHPVRTLMHATGLLLGALLIAATTAHADETVTGSFDTNAPGVSVSYTGGGLGTSAGVFENTTANGVNYGNSFCIDLWHEVGYNFSFSGTLVNSSANVASAAIWPDSSPPTPSIADPAFTKELNYLGSLYVALNTNLAAESTGWLNAMGAIQLGIWNLIDANFSTNASGGLLTDFNEVKSLLGGTNGSIEGVSLTGYSSNATYAPGTLFIVDRAVSGGGYQNLIAWSGPDGPPVPDNGISTPEPSTFAIAGLGVLAFAGYGLRRRARA